MWWSHYRDLDCLSASGWTDAELRRLEALTGDELAQRFAVVPAEFAEQCSSGAPVTMSGTFAVSTSAVHFVPRHPFVPELTYAWISREPDAQAQVLSIVRPVVYRPPAAEVAAIFPTAPRLPFNVLRFYIYFSVPMIEGDASRCVRLQASETGSELIGAILPMAPELWDRERRRLTVLLDPGRIKRGLVPNAESGYPLAEGQAVSLVVGEGFRDADGAALRARAQADYTVGPALRGKLAPEQWRIEAPSGGGTGPLRVHFDRPLDHALLQHCLRIVDPSGGPVPGHASISAGESSWRFVPEACWTGGRYSLLINPKLEDVAGNSVARVFDRDLAAATDDPRTTTSVVINFAITR